MLKKIAARLTYANVVSTIALFGVLAGGYAAAFNGHGSLERVNADLEADVEQTILSLDGMGKFRALCSISGNVSVSFRNTSGKGLAMNSNVRVIEANSDVITRTELADGEEAPVGIVGGGSSHAVIWLSIFPTGKSSRPQASGVFNLSKGCGIDSNVTALVLHTEQ